MYQEHFGFHQEPFSIAPDPSFLFLSDAHNEALAHLLYGFSHGGFVLITGEVGTGKTTLLRNLLDKTPPDLDVAFILNPRLTVRELLESLCDELGIAYTPDTVQSVKQYIDLLNKHLLKTHQAGRSTVVIIDEAQNLTPAVLEQIRLLTNLETNEKKLLRIILLGQPELGEQLARSELRQLAQRITARYHLTPLSKQDTKHYVSHRLARVGGNPNIFTERALNALYRISKGTPRLINVIADRALLGAYVQGLYQVDSSLIRQASQEVLGKPVARWGAPRSYQIGAAFVVVVTLGLILWAYTTPPQDAPFASIPHSTEQLAPPESEPEPEAENTLRQTSRPTNSINGVGNSATTAPADASTSTSSVSLDRPLKGAYILQREAYQVLFAQWGVDYPPDQSGIPCDFAPQVGLQCLRRSGGWAEIEQLNTPVILELVDDLPTPFYATLLGTHASTYVIELDQQRMHVSRNDLRDHWFGTYILLWQTPPSYIGTLKQGTEHPSVRWLREKLAQLDPHKDIETTSHYFDSSLRDFVSQFQSAENLLADGMVGPLTWIRISARLDLPAPKLRP